LLHLRSLHQRLRSRHVFSIRLSASPLHTVRRAPPSAPAVLIVVREKSASVIGPWLHLRALGPARLPLFCLPPNARGGALRAHALDFARAARGLPGDLAQEV